MSETSTAIRYRFKVDGVGGWLMSRLRGGGSDVPPELARLVADTMERHGLRVETALAIIEIIQQGRSDEQLSRILALLEGEAHENRA
jgi:hypothetical protein